MSDSAGLSEKTSDRQTTREIGDNVRASGRRCVTRPAVQPRDERATGDPSSSLLPFIFMTIGLGTAADRRPLSGSAAVPSGARSVQEDGLPSEDGRPPNSPHLDEGSEGGGPPGTGPDHRPLLHNDDVEWEEFSPEAYWDHNYRYLREDDSQIIREVGAFFSDHFLRNNKPVARGIDVGSGSNLYPALAMLPWCQNIELTDHSTANVDWLVEHISDSLQTPLGEWKWRNFWAQYRDHNSGYQTVVDARGKLFEATRGNIHEKSVFDLPVAVYDIGTMFFVAESMTSFENEFDKATACFLGSLRPGSPFAAAFMDSSEGYKVAGKDFPAVQEVTADLVKEVLHRQFGAIAEVKKIKVPPTDPLRVGYDGMIIATGTTGVS